jgi:hypothetical protein
MIIRLKRDKALNITQCNFVAAYAYLLHCTFLQCASIRVTCSAALPAIAAPDTLRGYCSRIEGIGGPLVFTLAGVGMTEQTKAVLSMVIEPINKHIRDMQIPAAFMDVTDVA